MKANDGATFCITMLIILLLTCVSAGFEIAMVVGISLILGCLYDIYNVLINNKKGVKKDE